MGRTRPAGLLQPASPRPARHADAVRLVDDEERAVRCAGAAEGFQGGEVAVHGEERLGDEQYAPAVAGGLAEPPVGLGRVAVPVAQDGASAGGATTVDDRRVVQLVGDDRRLVAQHSQETDVGQVAGADDEGAGQPDQLGALLLQRVVQRVVPGDQARSL